MPVGAIYRTVDSPVFKTANSQLVRYCKDYSVGKGKAKVAFCLFVRTDVDNDVIVEKQLDQVATEVTQEQALAASGNASFENFSYLPNLISLEVA